MGSRRISFNNSFLWPPMRVLVKLLGVGRGRVLGDGGVASRVAFEGDLERINKIACPINKN